MIDFAAHRRAFKEDGFCIIERVIPPADLEKASVAVAKLFPTAADMATNSDPRFATWDAKWPEFPFRSRTLNTLAIGDTMLDLASTLLESDEVRIYLGLATAKYAGQTSGFNQWLHADYPNQTLTVPHPRIEQCETLVYLGDVGRENGATQFVSHKHTRDIPIEEHTLEPDRHASIYERVVNAVAPAGSIVVYRPDTYHRSVDFDDPTQSRFLLHVSFKRGGMEWGGYQAWPFRGFSAELHSFVSGASARQLLAFGFPPPGDEFWCDATFEGVERRYPGIDLTVWRDAGRRKIG